MQNLSLPVLYERVIEFGVIDVEPWTWLRGSEQPERKQHVDEVFPGWGVTPFARRTDNDEVASWTCRRIVVIDDFDVVRDAGGAPTGARSRNTPQGTSGSSRRYETSLSSVELEEVT